MELNFTQLSSLVDTFTELKEQKLPFKLSLLIAKNSALLSNEMDFYIEREREFAQKYLVTNEETGEFVQERPGIYRIKEGLEDECREAREALNAFTTNIELRKIPMSLLENLEFTPKQLEAMEFIIDEEA